MTPRPCEDWIEAISAYADGEATAAERKSVEAHLSECEGCRKWLEAVRADRQAYAEAYATPERGAAYVGAVMAKLAGEQERAGAEGRPRRGFRFTVIELLTSAVIVLIVGAILFPCFSRAREKARLTSCLSDVKQIGVAREKSRQTSCLSNVKQLGLAFIMYAGDHSDYLPPAERWQEATLPYVRNAEIYKCPTDESGSKCSYAMPRSLSGAKLSDIPDAEKQPLVYDATPDGAFAKRHNEGGNVCFADGHAKWVRQAPEGAERGAAIGPADRNYGIAERLHLAYDASVSVETKEVLKSVHAAEQIVREQQGFVLDSAFTETGDRASAQMTFKVPSTRLEITLQALARLGHMIRRQVHGEDRTQSVVSVETKLRREGERQTRLRERLPKTKKETDRAPVESALQASEHETIAGRGQLYGQQSETVLATVSASFEAPGPSLSSWATVTRTFTKALNWSGRTAGIAGAWTVGLAPVWVPVALILLLARVVLGRRRAAASP